MSAFRLRCSCVLVLASLLLLSTHAAPAAEKSTRCDRFDDPLPDEALYRIGSARFRVGQQVFFLAFSKDGKTLLSVNEASSSHDGVVRRWDTATGKQLHQFSLRRVGGGPLRIALSPDGKFLAYLPAVKPDAEEPEPITLVDAATGRIVRTFAKQRHGPGITFSPGGQMLATSDKHGIIYLWNPNSGELLGKLEGCKRGNWGIVFAPDGKLLVRGDDKVPCLWDIKAQRAVRKFPRKYPQTLVWSASFSSDGKLLAVRPNEALEVWDTATGKRLRRLDLDVSIHLHVSPPYIALAISPDAKLLASADMMTISLWQTDNGKEVRQLGNHLYPNCVAFSPDGKRLAVGGSNIRLWEVATGEEVRPRGDESFVIIGADFSPDGRLLATAGVDGFIRLWKADTGAEVRRFQGETHAYPGLWFSPDGKSLFLNSCNGISQRDAESGKQKHRFTAPEFLRPFTVSRSGELFAWADRDQTVYVKDLSSGKELRRWRRKELGEWSKYLFFSRGGELLASLGDYGRHPKVFKVKTGDILPSLKHQEAFAGFSPDGRVIARTDQDGRIYFHETATGKELARTEIADKMLRKVLERQELFPSVFSPDGRTLATSIDSGSIRLWETATGRERHRFPGHEGWGLEMVFSPDGSKLATVGTENTALVWQVFGSPLKQRAPELSDRQLRVLWADLANGDAPSAFWAIRTLIASPSPALDLLRHQLRPVPRVDPQQLARWIAELDADSFVIREKAAAELAKLGRAVEMPLRKALNERPTLEARRRLQALLDEIESAAIPAKFLGTYRALEVLEHLATAEARQLLEELAEGEPEARLTREARASLERMRQRFAK